MKYYGLDYLAMLFGFLGVYLLGKKDKKGFITLLISNLLWFIVGFKAESNAVIFGNIIYIILNFKGFINWKR